MSASSTGTYELKQLPLTQRSLLSRRLVNKAYATGAYVTLITQPRTSAMYVTLRT